MDHQVLELLLITIPLPKIRILPDCLQGLEGEPCLNVAVANEVLGQNQQALDWAKKSYDPADTWRIGINRSKYKSGSNISA